MLRVALQVTDQLQDLRLGGDVERGRRLVRDQHGGLERQCHRDHHALALAAGQLVRIGPDDALGSGRPTSRARSMRFLLRALE